MNFVPFVSWRYPLDFFSGWVLVSNGLMELSWCSVEMVTVGFLALTISLYWIP